MLETASGEESSRRRHHRSSTRTDWSRLPSAPEVSAAATTTGARGTASTPRRRRADQAGAPPFTVARDDVLALVASKNSASA